jgi:hypothetical protein
MENETTHSGLTPEEELHYASHALIDYCDGCGNYTPIHNHNDGKNFLTFVGDKLYCQKCLK